MSIYPNAGQANPSNGESPEDKNVFLRIIKDFGGTGLAVEIGEKILNGAEHIFQNKTYRKTIRFLKRTLSLGIVGYGVHTSIKRFKEEKEEKSIGDKEDKIIKGILGVKGGDDAYIERYPLEIGKEISEWLLNTTKTKRFSILGYYDDDFKKTNSRVEGQKARLLIEIQNQKLFLETAFLKVGKDLVPFSTKIAGINDNYHVIELFRREIFAEFVSHFNTRDNVIIYKRSGLSIRKRYSVGHNIGQFDVDAWLIELTKAMKKGKKRGYVFVGKPGNGKSLIQVELEDKIRDYPIVYVYNSAFHYEEDVTMAFDFFRSIQPCIIIFEDLDSYGLHSKDSNFFSGFIEGLDNVHNEANICFIATVNDSSTIHYSLINRRGRFDKVFLIDRPKTDDEIIHVLKCRYKKNTGKEFLLSKTKLKGFLKEAHGLDRSDLCEIIDCMEITDLKLTVENLNKKLKEIKETKKALQECNFGGKDINTIPPSRKPSIRRGY